MSNVRRQTPFSGWATSSFGHQAGVRKTTFAAGSDTFTVTTFPTG